MRRLAVLAFFALFALSACSTSEQSEAPEALPGDDWAVAAPVSVGVSGAALDAVTEETETDFPKTTNLLVVKDGALIYERSFGTNTNTQAVPVYSVSKAVASALVGIGIEDGTFSGPEQKLADVLPAFAGADSRLQSATLADAMTMRVGLASVDDDIFAWFRSDDYVQHVLDREVIADPGTAYAYNTGATHLISAAISAQRAETMADYAERVLFGPIGITSAEWRTDPQGITVGGTDLSLTPRDMARFGQLFLNGGSWKGEQVVPAAWVRDSTSPLVVNPDGATYGYWWWPETLALDGEDLDVYSAIGYSGQRIVVAPALNAVVVITSDVGSSPVDNEKVALGLLRALLDDE